LSFAEHGSMVIIIGRDEDALSKVTKELKQFNSLCSYIVADISKTKEIDILFDKIHKIVDKIDILINNAGINIAKPALDITENDWDNVHNINLKSLFFCSKKVATNMISHKCGKIINIASQMAFVGYWNRSAYCASKGGVVQLTKALAIEWAEYNINVNAVAPTFVKTDLTNNMFEDIEFKKDVYKRIPFKKLASVEDVSNAVLFLSSNVSDFITGETIKVDGGWTAI